jgi:DNA polymerase I-like protein with 3'-5' exonuclease and polymerase domains
VAFSRTACGNYATSQEALDSLPFSEPFVDSLLAFKAVQTIQSTFLEKMGKRRLHPSFDVLKTTGRTSSFGEINSQNLPRDDRVRSCFIPSEGCVFISADYRTIEMATLAQAMTGQFGQPSAMREAINQGVDLHRLVAARVAGKPGEAVTSDERRRAKPINFGKPGGMGNDSLKSYARASYGVELSDEEIQELSDAWLNLFPEMRWFLSDEELGLRVAELLDLTPIDFYNRTGYRKFVDHPNNAGKQHLPHPILGAMCLKVLKCSAPQKESGQPYLPAEVDYFWEKVAERITTFPGQVHTAIRSRNPSPDVQRAVMRAAGLAGVFTLTGRLRANASYCARRNTLFQGLAADGAKLALWRLWRAGYRIVNFVHDEVLIEVPQGENLSDHAERIRQLMIDGMRDVVPDMRVEVEFAVARRWYKSARAVFDDSGTLQIWEPSPEDANGERRPHQELYCGTA